MFMNTAYLSGSTLPFRDLSKPLVVASCGTYHLRTHGQIANWRPYGREDYQLLYVAAGRAYFYFEGQKQEISAGHMVLYRPGQEQRYEYSFQDKPQVYWVHFTGSDVENILSHYRIPKDQTVFPVSGTHGKLFSEMIGELQTRRAGFSELLAMQLCQVFLLIQRFRAEEQATVSSSIRAEMDYARQYFSEHFSDPICIEDYARSRNMSISWFLRNFKQVTAKSPMQYILTLRISNAAGLLETTDYSISQIAALVGYDNPLYFSRLFKKQTGAAPTDYRKALRTQSGK